LHNIALNFAFMRSVLIAAIILASFPTRLGRRDRTGKEDPIFYLTPVQQFLLLCGLAGLILGVLSTLAGLHLLAHRGEYEPTAPPTVEPDDKPADDDTVEFKPVYVRESRPTQRGRW
jgi:hypothetical protein